MGTGMGTGTGTSTDVSTETDSIRRTCWTGRRTALDGCVEQGDRQCQTDVSNRETDSVRRTCRTERRTASDRRVGQGRAVLDERRRNEGIRGNGGNGSKCYTLNTMGSEYGYGPGRKVSETHHTVLGWHTETGQPTALGLGSGQPTLRHQEVPGPSTGADRESASTAAEEDNLGGHHKKDKQSEGNVNARSCEPRSRDSSGVVSRGAAQRNNTTSRESLYRRRRLRGLRRYRCTPWSEDTRDDATTRILVIDTRLWR